MNSTRNDIIFYISLIFAIWFALTGVVWAYAAALFISYPCGLISFLLWWRIRNENRARTKIIPRILIGGLIVSAIVFLSLVFFS